MALAVRRRDESARADRTAVSHLVRIGVMFGLALVGQA
jgi:hypothetical protein